jgi:hypothetical protein
LWWAGGQGAETGRVALYNEDGTIGSKVSVTTSACSPAWVNHAGDASDPFKPKTDFGDAPASYDPAGVDPATHEYDCNLHLGATFDREWTKAASSDATGDGPDEDGLPVLPVFTHTQTTYDCFVHVYNNTGANATVASWIDINNNGVFDPSEGITVTVPTSAAMQNIHLVWAGQPMIASSIGGVFMRIRVTSLANGMTVNKPTGYFANGEVEDYLVIITSLLPIKLTSFEAKPGLNRYVDVSWSVSSEQNMQSYIIERSKDGVLWQEWKVVTPSNDPSGEINYTDRDNDPLSGVSYYRLRMVAYSGDVSYSSVRRVDFEDQNFSIYSVNPNPFTDILNVTIASRQEGQFTIKLLSVDGRTILNKRVAASTGNNSFSLDGLAYLTPGVYVLEVQIGSQIARQRLVKQ